jgi:predicted transcriptional regulator
VWRLTLLRMACSLLHMEQAEHVDGVVASEVSKQISKSGVTVVWLCEETGIPRSTLSRRLSSRSSFTLNELQRIAEALRVPVSDLLQPVTQLVSA